MYVERGNGMFENGCSETAESRGRSGTAEGRDRQAHTQQKRSEKARVKRLRAVILFALAALLALALAGCSSGSSKDASEDLNAMSMANQAAPAPAEQAVPAMGEGAAAYESLTVAREGNTADAVAGAPAAGQGNAGIGTLADPGVGLNRKVIYKANVSMKVEHFATAEEKLKDVIHLSGSYILQFNNNVSANEKGATYVIKVPADGFSSFLDQLRKIQPELQMQMEGSDVTEEYVDLDSRLKAKQAAEARLLAFMDKATKTDDLIQFQSQLAGVQEQIEQLKGRMRYLDQNVAFSTVNIRIYEGKAEAQKDDPAKSGLGERLADALTGSAKVLGQLGQALLVFVAALLPVLVVAAVVGIPVYFIVRRQSRIRREAAAERRKEWNHSFAPTLPATPIIADEASAKADTGENAGDDTNADRSNNPNHRD